jgi:hypothetical protein
MRLIKALERRNDFQAGNACGVAAWLLKQVPDQFYPRIGLPGSAVTLVISFNGQTSQEISFELF